ncbi:MAG: hypothetical protein AAGI24_04190 [Pseudomonadota bacterium]
MAATYELIQLLGRNKLTALQCAIGPRAIYIPVDPTPDHPISRAIGEQGMEKICGAFGGSTIWIGNRYANARRNEEILRLLLIGVDKETVAARFGVTTKTVRIISHAELRPAFGLRARRRRARCQGLKQDAH